MKHIVLFLIFEFLLFSQTLYILPDDVESVIHYLEKAIDHAEKKVVIITHTFDNYKLKKVLIKASKRDVNITLISTDVDQKKSLALYQNIDARSLLAIESPKYKGRIATSLILIDDRLTCTLSSSLENVQMHHDIGLFTCNNDSEYADRISKAIAPLIARSRPYLDY